MISAAHKGVALLLDRDFPLDQNSHAVCWTSNRQAGCFHDRLKGAAESIKSNRTDCQVKILSSDLTLAGLFDCCREVVLSVEDGYILEKFTGEKITSIIGTKLSKLMSYEEVMHVLKNESELLCEVRLVFKTRCGQIVVLGYIVGEWRLYEHDNPILDLELQFLDNATFFKATGREKPIKIFEYATSR